MAGWAVPEEETSGEKQQQQLLQPWILKMNQVAGVGGVSILGGIFIAAAFAGSRFLTRRSSAPCQGPHEEGKIRAGDKEDHKLEIMQKEIYDLVQEMKHVERTPLLEDSELDNVEKEEEDEQNRGVLDKTKFPCTNINGEDINLSSSYVSEEGMEVFTNVSEVEEEEEEDYSSEEEEEEEEDDYDDADEEEEDEVMEMGELGAEVTPVSSSSSLGSNSEAIWPAEKLEQKKTSPSVLILNNSKIERVKKDVMHIEEEEEEGSESEQIRDQSFCEEDSSSEKVKTRARSRRRMTESRDKNEFMKAFSGLLLLLLMAVMLICLGLLLISSMENANYHLRRHFQKHPWHFLHAIFAAA